MLPGISSVEAVRIYRSFRGYAEKEISFGVVAIGMSITNVLEKKILSKYINLLFSHNVDS
jgi:hypothetical protein